MGNITIVRCGNIWVVEDGVAKGAGLYWRCERLNVYVLGALPIREYGRVANIAMNYLISIGGRAVELERYIK